MSGGYSLRWISAIVVFFLMLIHKCCIFTCLVYFFLCIFMTSLHTCEWTRRIALGMREFELLQRQAVVSLCETSNSLLYTSWPKERSNGYMGDSKHKASVTIGLK